MFENRKGYTPSWPGSASRFHTTCTVVSRQPQKAGLCFLSSLHGTACRRQWWVFSRIRADSRGRRTHKVGKHFADSAENAPRAVATVLQHIVGVCGVGEVELAVDGHTAAFFNVKAFNKDIIWRNKTHAQTQGMTYLYKTNHVQIHILDLHMISVNIILT